MGTPTTSNQRSSDSSHHLEVQGVVRTASKGIFQVEVESLGGMVITCKPAGRLRIHRITVLIGDRVICAVSPYDTSNGIIQRRL